MSTRTHSPWRVLALLLLALSLVAPLARPVAAADADVPTDAIRVCESCEATDLQAAIDAATDGDTIVVEGGAFDGPIEIAKPLTLIGARATLALREWKAGVE